MLSDYYLPTSALGAAVRGGDSPAAAEDLGTWGKTWHVLQPQTGRWDSGKASVPHTNPDVLVRFVPIKFYVSFFLLFKEDHKVPLTYSFHQAFQRRSLEHQGIEDFFRLLSHVEQH